MKSENIKIKAQINTIILIITLIKWCPNTVLDAQPLTPTIKYIGL